MGVSLQDYEAIFEEKFDLLLQLNREKSLTGKGIFGRNWKMQKEWA